MLYCRVQLIISFLRYFLLQKKVRHQTRVLTVREASFQKFVFCLQGFTIQPDDFFDHKFAVIKSNLKLPIILHLDVQGFGSS